MILERSKALQSENTSLRVERDRLTDELSAANKSLATTTRESERQQTLIAELEDHVERLQDLTAGTVSRPEAEGRYVHYITTSGRFNYAIYAVLFGASQKWPLVKL